MKREIKVTADGSHTIYVPEIDEHYHSIHGAIQESQHVFIDQGIDALFASKIKVLEVGFGTGLNALLSSIWSHRHKIPVDYTGIEAYPLEMNVLNSLNYAEHFESSFVKKYFDEIISSDWGIPSEIHADFTLTKIDDLVEQYFSKQKFDIVYFDAFGPRFQKELWEMEILKKTFDYLNPNGLFVTYSAKGQLKRDLKKIGFKVESIPGPPGKREMTRARKF